MMGWGTAKTIFYWAWEVGEFASVLDVQSFFLAEPKINILLTRNLPFDSGVRERKHPLMIPLHCLG